MNCGRKRGERCADRIDSRVLVVETRSDQIDLIVDGKSRMIQIDVPVVVSRHAHHASPVYGHVQVLDQAPAVALEEVKVHRVDL